MKNGLIKKKPLYIMVCAGLLVLLGISLLLAVAIGSTKIPISEVYSVIVYELFGIGDASISGLGPVHDVVWLIRLPRLVLAIAVGMGLSVCGVVMQAIVRNPMADPYVLGISSGASLGATMAIMIGIGASLGTQAVGVCACVGAFGISILVMAVASIGGRASSIKLILSGMALSSLCSSFSSFIIYYANDKEGMISITYWLMGSLAGANWNMNAFILPFILCITLFFWSQYRTMNMMLLGDEVAVTLGTDLHQWRILYLVLSSAMIGFIVYASGMIGFVGLVIPHLMRMLFGTDHRRLLPVSALVGSIYLLWADVLSRIVIHGTELPIGILTSMIGAPCFIYMMVHKKYGFGGGAE